ncbi:MAG: bifunctional 5,10-methylene-tetrahydrofolate dehydrogenase/5,10-methylene-tetrahydrofolate cyclohydrolase [Anaerolineae bacterium]|nr:bifunctional 5,10-methylene-tetrahydrofolate dehydrogenase/5,10-methylene-tetrahydrofolate cyclohydrolase [Anaerolineae bacterium]
MAATILDGRELSKTLRGELDAQVAAFVERTSITPTIALVRAGEDPASVSYARVIERGFAARGMGFVPHILPESATQDEIVAAVSALNADDSVHGIMVQEPLPKGIDEAAIKAALSPEKDVDGVHPLNAGRLAQVAPAGRPAGVGPFFVPATPAGGLEMLKRYGVALEGRTAVVLGRSNIVGKPMALLLLRENATVTLCHSRTADLAAVCRQADVLCVAVGRAKMVKAGWVKPGAVVIDFGVNFENGNMCGDVDYDDVVGVAGMITPVPGGTGPMTNVMLMRNVLEAATRQAGAP